MAGLPARLLRGARAEKTLKLYDFGRCVSDVIHFLAHTLPASTFHKQTEVATMCSWYVLLFSDGVIGRFD